MTHPAVAAITLAANNAITVMEGAEITLNGVTGLIRSGVEEAMANGATKEQLDPFVQLAANLDAETGKVSAAIANVANANEPPAPVQP